MVRGRYSKAGGGGAGGRGMENDTLFFQRQINSDMNTHTWGMHAWLTSPKISLQTLYGESNYK